MDTIDSEVLDILHLDMDCFFAAVEVLENPALMGLPVMVGGTSDRGVVASASYEARAFGVHAAMSTFEARRRCPEGVFIHPNHDLYSKMSKRLLDLVRRVTPSIEPIAFDEAFIDVSGAHRLFGSSLEIAQQLRSDVASELGLTCSVGIGRTKLIAKLASKDAKPHVTLSTDGQRRVSVIEGAGIRVVRHDEEADFLREHPLRALPGIGPKTMGRLQALGITTVADAVEVGRDRLCGLFGNHLGNLVADAVNGIDSRQVEPERATRSIGHETTFSHDLYDRETLESRIKEFALLVVSRSRVDQLVGKTVTVKIRFADFTMLTRSKTPSRPAHSSAEVAEIAIDLLDGVEVHRGIRLLGLHLSNFFEADQAPGRQLSLFDEEVDADVDAPDPRRHDLEEAVDEIRHRFGDGAVDPLAVAARKRRSSETAENSSRQGVLMRVCLGGAGMPGHIATTLGGVLDSEWTLSLGANAAKMRELKWGGRRERL